MSTQSTEGETGVREDDIDLEGDVPALGNGARIGDSAQIEGTLEADDDVLPELSEDVVAAGNEVATNTDLLATPPQRPVDDSASVEDTLSIPDDTPSVQGSILSSPRSDALQFSRPSSMRSASGTHRPFDRRFQSRLSSSPLNISRAASPAFLNNHSRQSSLASVAFNTTPEPDPTSAPWDVIRWTKLRKITGQAFSEVGKRNYGRPTYICVSSSIIIGTSKGIVLVFDYQQVHKGIIGLGTQAVECGAVTSLAVSADHSTIASGHASGHIFTWELARSARPFLHIQPVDNTQPQARRSDGHVPGVAILHLGFLGTRHTALVSADDRGMAFSHLASRGMGTVGRTVKTIRVLGRYPDLLTRGAKPRKPSAVLAFAPLPLGNVEQSTDGIGLVAMMTPYLLVIVSTTPIAQTQHKAARPKEMSAHGAMSAALAWFPAIKLKAKHSQTSKTKLVYCWSNVLSILEVDEIVPVEPSEKAKPPELTFETVSTWTSEEAIVAVQWLSRSVLAILTISQQLLILEDQSMQVTDSFDLLPKHIFHADLFSNQLHTLVEQLDEEDTSMHGVVADAFYSSVRAYKGRLFLLGFNDVVVGSLSNWADRLLAMMESGDFVAAIRLATDYYNGTGEKLTIGLPDEDEQRHDVVQVKLTEMISASLKYAFGRNHQAGSEQLEKPQLAELAAVCIAACISMDDREFLFDEVYSWYEDHDMVPTFLDTLEPNIVSGEVRSLPPPAVKSLIEHYMTNHAPSNLEEIICLLDTSSMDIDQVTTLCKRNNLYDAYIYVWTKTLEDFVGPLEELLQMAELPTTNGHDGGAAQRQANAMKCFPYLSFILTGRIYPGGGDMPGPLAMKAKAQLYTFLFSGNTTTNSAKAQSGKFAVSKDHAISSFPHLRSILLFDAASFMSVLNEVFEDVFLNDASEQLSDDDSVPADGSSPVYNQAINRQFIVSILLEVMTPPAFDPEDTIFLDMFLARNLPKYPQYILLSGTTLHQVLIRLCQFPSEDLAEDCQLSVEYLLSVYHPPDFQALIPTFEEAKFYRVLKSVYKTEKQYSELVQTFFDDAEDQEDVFDAIHSLLRSGSDLSAKQRRDLNSTVRKLASRFLDVDVKQTAIMVARFLPEMHDVFLSSIQEDPHAQFQYLRALMEPESKITTNATTPISSSHLTERYVQLMCRYDPKHVPDYIDTIRSGDLRLDEVLPALETSGIIDAAVILLARQGQVKDAMERLKKHLEMLEAALAGIMQSFDESPDVAATDEAVEDLLESLDKYGKVGIWLCQKQTSAMPKAKAAVKPNRRSDATGHPMSFEEMLWLELVNAVVGVARNVLPTTDSSTGPPPDPHANITTALRSLIQQVFTALLTATTSTRTAVSNNDRPSLSFLRILRAFLTNAAASSPSLSQLRAVISSIFSAYAYEESLLALANEILDKDLFVHVDEVAKLRQQGWRPRGQICEICRRRVWGPGSGGGIWDAWKKKQENDLKKRLEREMEREERNARAGEGTAVKGGKGKATVDVDDEAGTRDHTPHIGDVHGEGEGQETEEVKDRGDLGPILVFACRHVVHQRCLQRKKKDKGSAEKKGEDNGNGEVDNAEEEIAKCPACERGEGLSVHDTTA